MRDWTGILLIIFVASWAACDEAVVGGDLATSCENWIDQCPDTLQQYGIDSAQSCTETYACVQRSYTPACKEMLRTLFDCAETLTSGDCSACDAQLQEMTTSCPYPAACIGSGKCQTAASAVCQAACACQASTQCYTSYGSGVLVAEYDDLNHCLTFESYVCESSSSEDSAIQACIDALDFASCETVTHDGSTVEALAMPAECTAVDL